MPLSSATTSTPTLALGVNLPAEAVIIRDMQRYTVNGLDDSPIREYLQMSGRAGRPNYGRDGLSIIVGKSGAERRAYWGGSLVAS